MRENLSFMRALPFSMRAILTKDEIPPARKRQNPILIPLQSLRQISRKISKIIQDDSTFLTLQIHKNKIIEENPLSLLTFKHIFQPKLIKCYKPNKESV